MDTIKLGASASPVALKKRPHLLFVDYLIMLIAKKGREMWFLPQPKLINNKNKSLVCNSRHFLLILCL